MSLLRLSPACRAYVRAFNITAIVVYRDGRIGVSRDPQGAAEAWWIQSDKAGAVLSVARALRIDIPTAAAKCGLSVTPHEVVIVRASAAVERIETRVAKANDTGAMSFFNGEYRKRRIAAAEEGRGFMSYQVAQVRLRRALSAPPRATLPTLVGGALS